jgi:hypothetical protein
MQMSAISPFSFAPMQNGHSRSDLRDAMDIPGVVDRRRMGLSTSVAVGEVIMAEAMSQRR